MLVRGDGKGGRNQEIPLSGAIQLAGWDNVVLFSGGTDGTDGPTDAAGAVADGQTIARAEALRLSAIAHLKNNDAYHFFKPLDDLIITGANGEPMWQDVAPGNGRGCIISASEVS